MVLYRDKSIQFVELPGTDLHKYILTLDDGATKELIGVTTLMHRLGLSKSYASADPDVLARAAARGTAIHELLQDYEMGEFVVNTIQYTWTDSNGKDNTELEDCSALLRNYGKLSKDNFRSVAVEYLVSDFECVASMVDYVSQVDEHTVDLIDYKSGRQMDKKALQWQLSFYKYLFERMNPTIKVRDLVGVHCNNARSLKLVSVPYLGDDAVEAKLEAYKEGRDEPETETLPVSFGLTQLVPHRPDLEMLLGLKMSLQKKMDDVEEEIGDALEELKDAMMEQHIADITVPGGKYVLVGEHEQTRFDSKKFKTAEPEMYEKYTTSSTVAAALKFYKDR